jgi:hypothetical protein
MISARWAANLIAGAGAAIAAVLYRFPPQEYSFYPRCPVYALTHRLCPGCGATRATAELLHGHLVAALHFNSAVILLMPFVLFYLGKMYWNAVTQNRVEWPQIPLWAVQAGFVGVVLFTLARNLTQNTL